MTGPEFLAWRKRLGLTQAQAAKALGRHVNTISYYERGLLPVPRVVVLACAAMDRQRHRKGRAKRSVPPAQVAPPAPPAPPESHATRFFAAVRRAKRGD